MDPEQPIQRWYCSADRTLNSTKSSDLPPLKEKTTTKKKPSKIKAEHLWFWWEWCLNSLSCFMPHPMQGEAESCFYSLTGWEGKWQTPTRDITKEGVGQNQQVSLQ